MLPLDPRSSGNLGKYLTSLMSRGHWWQNAWWLQYFNVKISSLQEPWGLGSQRANAVLLIATTMLEPKAKHLGSRSRGQSLAYDAAAQVYHS